MPRMRRTPQRTCVGCAEVEGKRDLVRIVRSPDGAVALDPTGKRNGRGAYVHRDADCFARAVGGRLWKALRVAPDTVDVPGLRSAFEALLAAPVPRRPLVHRAAQPLPEHLSARNRRGPTRTPPRRTRSGGAAPAGGGPDEA